MDKALFSRRTCLQTLSAFCAFGSAAVRAAVDVYAEAVDAVVARPCSFFARLFADALNKLDVVGCGDYAVVAEYHGLLTCVVGVEHFGKAAECVLAGQLAVSTGMHGSYRAVLLRSAGCGYGFDAVRQAQAVLQYGAALFPADRVEQGIPQGIVVILAAQIDEFNFVESFRAFIEAGLVVSGIFHCVPFYRGVGLGSL